MYQSYKSRIFRNCSQYYYLSKTGKRNSLDHTAQLWLNHSSDKVLGTIHPDSCLKQLSYHAIYNPLSRQYMDYNEMNITYNFDTNTYDTLSLVYERGKKFFELCNHLGNVMVSISDRKLPKDTLGDNSVDHFRADVLSDGDYYAFGMQMPGRNYSLYEYRFGFNGQEKDNEVYGTGNSYTAEFWQYDSRLVRRWNVFPVVKPWISSYHAFSNKPIFNIDPSGALDDDVFINSETSEITIIKTDDDFDREFVDGVEIEKHEQGWGEEKYKDNPNVTVLDIGPEWNREYLYEGNRIVAFSAYRFVGFDKQNPGIEFYFGVSRLSGNDQYGFSQTLFAKHFGWETSNGYKYKDGGYKSDNNKFGFYGGLTYKGRENSDDTKGFDVLMFDRPRRPGLENTEWTGQTSVIKYNNMNTTRLRTIEWGFVIINSELKLKPHMIAIPSEYHKKHLPQ